MAEYDELGKVIPITTDVYEDDYDNYTLEELNKMLQDVDSSNQVVHTLSFEELPTQVYNTIEEYRIMLEDKCVDLYEDDWNDEEE